MNERTGFSGYGVLMAFVGGAVAGGVAAVLLAPKSGAETRQDIKQLAVDGADKIGRVPAALKDAYSQSAEMAKEAFSEAFNGDKVPGKHKSLT